MSQEEQRKLLFVQLADTAGVSSAPNHFAQGAFENSAHQCPVGEAIDHALVDKEGNGAAAVITQDSQESQETSVLEPVADPATEEMSPCTEHPPTAAHLATVALMQTSAGGINTLTADSSGKTQHITFDDGRDSDSCKSKDLDHDDDGRHFVSNDDNDGSPPEEEPNVSESPLGDLAENLAGIEWNFKPVTEDDHE